MLIGVGIFVAKCGQFLAELHQHVFRQPAHRGIERNKPFLTEQIEGFGIIQGFNGGFGFAVQLGGLGFEFRLERFFFGKQFIGSLQFCAQAFFGKNVFVDGFG